MSQTSGELADYVKRVGEHINLVYKRLEEIEGKLNSLSGEISELKAAIGTNKADIDSLRESVVSKSEFDDFVKKLTESFRELLPPVPKETMESQKQV